MPKTQMVTGLRIFRLPARADGSALAGVLDALSETPSPSGVQCVLDFTSCLHIRYQDLQQFTHVVRERLRPARPILLAGLSPYCGEIVRFALRAEDWDLFRMVERVVSAERAWGNNAGSTVSTASWGRDAQMEDGRRILPLPSLN